MRTLPGNPNQLDKQSRLIQFFLSKANRFPLLPSNGRYNLTISHQHKFIWFRVAKVATRTILNHFQTNHIHLDVEHAGFIFYPPRLFTSYYKFAFVRNPWDRLVSCWLDKVIHSNFYRFEGGKYEKMKEFEHFVDFVTSLNLNKCDRHLRPQSALIDLNHLDYLGRMETFDTDIGLIFHKLGISKQEVEPKNVTADKKPFQTYYNHETRQKVFQIYQKDIQIFGYEFD